jgi:hypothetical protein
MAIFCFALLCFVLFGLFSLLRPSSVPFHAFLLHDFSASITFGAEEIFPMFITGYAVLLAHWAWN